MSNSMSLARIEEIGKTVCGRVELRHPDYEISFNAYQNNEGELTAGGIISYKHGGGEQQYEINGVDYFLVASEEAIESALEDQITAAVGRMASGKWLG